MPVGLEGVTSLTFLKYRLTVSRGYLLRLRSQRSQ